MSMKKLFILLSIVGFYSCCKEACLDEGLLVHTRNMQAVDTDTVYLIRYKAYTRFSEKIDTVKSIAPVPAGSTLPSAFSEVLDYSYDWQVVIPALNKEYFISNLLTEKKRCNCESGTYRTVSRYWLNSTQKEGNVAVLD